MSPDLATGRLALTPQALHLLANWRTVAYLRDLLMACGALPAVDKQLLHFETWLAYRLAEPGGDPHQRLLRRFATWEQLPRLRARADRNPLTTSSRRFTSEQFTAARTFLAWAGGRGGTSGACTQADIDTWHATHLEHQKNTVRAFLNWAMKNRIMVRLDLPVTKPGKGNQITQHRRLELIRRAVTDDHLPLRTRVAACLMLLYAQPVSRLRRLTTDDVIRQDGEVLIRLGDPPAPVPRAVRRPAPRTGRQPGEHDHRHQPERPLAVPGAARRPAAQRGHSPGGAAAARLLDRHRPPLSTPAPRAPGTSARHRPDPWLPRSDRQQDLDRRWQDLEPVRPRRPHTVTMSDQPPRNTRCSDTRLCQSQAPRPAQRP